MERTPLALVTSDLHFSDKMPRCRQEKDWLGYQEGVIDWLKDTCDDLSVPAILVGDIFDRHKHSNELVNLLIDKMPMSFVTFGNHDISGHCPELKHKSAYGTFIRSKVATEMNEVREMDGVNIHPFHFGHESSICEETKGINIALVHEFVWQNNEPFPGCPPKGEVNELVKRFQGYDIIFAGDHHEYFTAQVGDTTVVNCGSLMRISASQCSYQPVVHLLYTDGHVKQIEVPIGHDKISNEHLTAKSEIEDKIESFVSTLERNEEIEQLTFEERISRAIIISEANGNIEEILREAMNG